MKEGETAASFFVVWLLWFVIFFSAASESGDAVHHLVTHEIGSTVRAAKHPLTHGCFLSSLLLSPLFYGSLPPTTTTGTKTPYFICRLKTEASVPVNRCIFSSGETFVLNILVQSQNWRQQTQFLSVEISSYQNAYVSWSCQNSCWCGLNQHHFFLVISSLKRQINKWKDAKEGTKFLSSRQVHQLKTS